MSNHKPRKHELVYVSPNRAEGVCICGSHISVPVMTISLVTLASAFARHIRDENEKARIESQRLGSNQ